MFNLLVSGVAGAWEGVHLDMDLDRFKEYSGKYGEIIDPYDPASLRQLNGAPALVMYEIGVDGPNAKIVRHGRLRNVARYGQVVSCQIELDADRPYLAREKIVEFARHLDMKPFEQGRTHWAIKDGDLPPALLESSFKTLDLANAPGAEGAGTAREALVDGVAVLPEAARVVAVIVALENYRPADANQVEPVEFAKADAEGFKLAVETIFADHRPEVVVLADSDATHASVVNEIKSRAWGLAEDDLFIFYYAGHGFHDETGNRLTAWDTSVTNIAGTTLSLDADLLGVMRASPCQRVLAFIDACATRFKALGRKVITPLDTAEFARLLQSASFNAIFMSCRPGEQSYPDRDLGHGVWTHFLLQALNGAAPDAVGPGGYITNATLQDYLRQEVPRHVAQNPRIKATQTPEAVVTATNTFAIRRVTEAASSPRRSLAVAVAASNPEPSRWKRSKEPFPGSSTALFHDRFASAFPGVREPRWFTDPADIQRRLTRLLAPPLTFANGAPFWWWADGNLHIEKFEHVEGRRYLMDVHELEIVRIAAVPGRGYWGDFVYVEVAPMPPTGANPNTAPEDIARRVGYRGYDDEEYGLVDGRIAISRGEYDDGAAEIDGDLVDTIGRAALRVRYLTPYSFLLAANGSPINNNDFDLVLPKLLRAVLADDKAFEQLVRAVEQLPRREREK